MPFTRGGFGSNTSRNPAAKLAVVDSNTGRHCRGSSAVSLLKKRCCFRARRFVLICYRPEVQRVCPYDV